MFHVEHSQPKSLASGAGKSSADNSLGTRKVSLSCGRSFALSVFPSCLDLGFKSRVIVLRRPGFSARLFQRVDDLRLLARVRGLSLIKAGGRSREPFRLGPSTLQLSPQFRANR